MPTNACQFFYECTDCGSLLRPKPGDCCVFCSYGSIPCPPIQAEHVTSEQQRGFEQFFRSVRSLRAGFAVSHLEVTGATAEARVSGAYDFVGSDGKSQHQPITFRATLRRDGGAWRLVAVN